MKSIRVNVNKSIDDSYDIVIGQDLFAEMADGLAKLSLKPVIITDANIKHHYGEKLLEEFKKKHLETSMMVLPSVKKNLAVVEKIADSLHSYGFDGKSVLLALGGAAIGDLTGFVAQVKNLPYLQVPTTLRAMVDTCIGGEVKLHTQKAKDNISLIYHPKRTFIDINLLHSLASEELLHGLSEMIRQAVVKEEKYLVFLNDYMQNIKNLDPEVLERVIAWSCTIKKDLMEADSLGLLKFGSTIGDILEEASGYTIPHDQALALGMIAETRIASDLKAINSINTAKILDIIKKAGFPSTFTTDTAHIFALVNARKKKGNLTFSLPKKVGEVHLAEVPNDTIAKVLTEMKV